MARRPKQRIAKRRVVKRPTRRARHEGPAIPPPPRRPHNLPVQLTTFIGREQEIAEVKRLLGAARLLTLTGPGGCGKTRLALRVVADSVDQHPDGVWFVDLAPLADAAFIPSSVAAALDVPEQPTRPLTDTLADYLRTKTLLLVLDNCEHLRTACQVLADRLLRASDTARILATSREVLGVEGESTYRVPPLGLPDVHHAPSVAHLTEYDAIRLFAERAALVQPGFTITPSNAPAVLQICQRLDGMRLALEFAAARIRTLSAEQIAARLGDRFQLLTGASSMAVPRHQTLQATMDWSHDLLSKQEQALLRRLSVFAGGCTLEAAEAVCAGGGLERAEVLDLLTQLIDKSLVQVEAHEGEARYSLLETVRQYGRQRLEEAGDALVARQRHFGWYLALAERAAQELLGPNEIAWLERLEQDHDNFRAAIEWSRIEPGEEAGGLRLVVALYQFLEIRGHFAEVRQWLDDMLSRHKNATPLLRAKALNLAGHLAYSQGDPARVVALCEEALAIAQTAGDKTQTAQALHYLAHAAEGVGDYRHAAGLLERSIALHREAGSVHQLGTALHCLANTGRFGPNAQRNLEKSAALFEEALTIFRTAAYSRGTTTTLHNLGYLALHRGNHRKALALFRDSLMQAKDAGDRRALNCLAGLAGVAARTAPERAARLFGAAATLMAAAGVSLEPVNRADHDRSLAAVKAHLGERAFEGLGSRARR